MRARNITVHLVRSCEKRTTMPSSPPIQREMRTRWKRRRPPRPGSMERTVAAGERVEQRGAALVPALRAPARVEGPVDLGSRAFRRVAREKHDDPEVLRELERREVASVAGAELRPLVKEERDVGADSRRERVQLVGGERLGERAVGEAERGRGVGASAAETRRERDVLLDLHAPA